MKTTDLTFTALGAVIIAVCSWITVPAAVPFTMQTFAVFFVLSLLGGKRGTVSILLYLLLGAVGLPVFAGFTGGIGVLIGPLGGYLLGFLLSGLIFISAERFFGGKQRIRTAALLFGLLVCYAFGTAWFVFVYTRNTGAIGVGTALGWCVLPFVLPDLIKLILASMLAARVRTAIKPEILHEQ